MQTFAIGFVVALAVTFTAIVIVVPSFLQFMILIVDDE